MRTGVAGAVAVLVTASTIVGAGALTGTFTEIEPPIPDGVVFGTDINDAGQVVGNADFAGGRHGFLRDADGTYTELVPLGGDSYSGAQSINNDGDVVGQSGGAGASSAVIWTGGGAPTDLGSLPGEAYLFAVDISDSGWIVGNASDTSQAWYIDPDVGTVEIIDPVAGATITQVRAINDAGVAVGRVYVDSVFEPFIWNVDDGMTLLAEPPGEEGFEPTQINNAGQISGHVFEFIAPEGVYRAYVLDPDDGYQELTVEGYESAFPHGLSDSGWVVGFVDNPESESRVPAAWNLTDGDAAAFPLFSDAAFTNELNAVNDTGGAVGISREGEDFERTYLGQVSPEPPLLVDEPLAPPPSPVPGEKPVSRPAQVVRATPNFTG